MATLPVAAFSLLVVAPPQASGCEPVLTTTGLPSFIAGFEPSNQAS